MTHQMSCSLLGFHGECSGEEEKMDRLPWEEKSSEVLGLVETLQLDRVAHGEGDWKVHAKNMSRMEAQTRAREEALEVEARRENARLLQEREDLQREMSVLRGESQDLTGKLQAMEREVSLQTARAEDQQATHDHEIRERTALIDSLIQEVTHLGQEVMPSQAASGVQRDSKLLRDKIAELKRECSEALEERLLLKEKLAQQLIIEQELKEKLAQQQIIEQELKEKLAQQQIIEQELGELKEKLAQQQIIEQELKEKLAQQQVIEQELVELKEKLAQQQVIEQELVELKEKLAQQELTSEQLKAEMEAKEAHVDSENSVAERETAEWLRELNSDLQAEVATLKGKMAYLEEKESTRQTESEATVTVCQTDRVAELEKILFEKEAQVSGLQRSLREAQERWEDEETAAVQEARRREVERRRELLAVAEEAIAQKDAELKKRVQDIARLNETIKLDSDKIKSLSLDLERKDDDNSDLKEKLADTKKQIQQVQKEIISMREEEKSLKLQVQDLEKVKNRQQTDLVNKDRTIHQLKTEHSADSKSEENLKLYQNACKDLQAKERLIEDMRLALTEQEDTQTQQEQVLEAKLDEIDTLTEELEKVKGLLRYQDNRKDTAALRDGQSDEAKLAKQEAIQAQVTSKLCTEKHQADRRKWLEEKMVLIRQAKEAEDKRNQEMRKFADGRERHAKQQTQVEDLVAQLSEKEQDLVKWRKERDTLVTALEVQLTKLLSSIADKDEQIASLRCNATSQPAERHRGQVEIEELQSLLSERDAEILNLKEQLKAVSKASSNVSSVPPTKPRETATLTKAEECPPEVSARTLRDSSQLVHGVKTEKRTSQDDVNSENRRNTRTRMTSKLAVHQEETSPARGSKDQDSIRPQDSQSSLRSKKEGTMQKIGDFLQSSPTFFGSKAKKIMGLVSGKSPETEGGASMSFRPKKSKRKLYRPEISSPMDFPSHPIIGGIPDEKEGDHLIIKRKLRTRTAK
uniref:Kinesin family member 20Ba n=1 Tax=Hucho hucho TaxID=62062 RepID=A0A4W5RXR8_9TELE